MSWLKWVIGCVFFWMESCKTVAINVQEITISNNIMKFSVWMCFYWKRKWVLEFLNCTMRSLMTIFQQGSKGQSQHWEHSPKWDETMCPKERMSVQCRHTKPPQVLWKPLSSVKCLSSVTRSSLVTGHELVLCPIMEGDVSWFCFRMLFIQSGEGVLYCIIRRPYRPYNHSTSARK